MCAGNGAPCNRWYYKKSWISSKLHRGERQKRVYAFNGCLKLLVLQYMDSCVELEGKKRWVIPYKVSLDIPYTV